MADSRNEDLLENILGASNDYGEPQSRNEAILQNILGEQNELLPPVSRIETLLLQLKDAMPSGEIEITENGEHDVTAYATATVNVAGGGGITGGYTVTFKVDGEDYYIASCEAGGTITEPPTPTSQSGVFAAWQLNGTDVTFPYTPSADVELTAYFGYQEVEYIEATGTQYIDTGITAADYDTFEIRGAFTSTSGTQCMIAYTQVSNQNTSAWFGSFDSKFNFAPLGNTNVWYALGNNDTNEHLFKYCISSKTAQVDNTSQTFTVNLITKNDTKTSYLFARNNYQSNSAELFCSFQMKSAKFYDESLNLVADFVPCYRISDNEIGMYDLVTKTFLTNAGTGTFLKGADI